MGRRNFFSSLEEMLTFTPGDLECNPPSQLHLLTSPGIESEMLRELWNAARAHRQRADETVEIRPPSGARPIHDAVSIAGELKGDSTEGSNMGLHYSRQAQTWSSGEENARLEG